ncbi:MAG: hypothetical protein A2Y25_06180 [Candidatus Melainabacteria bacterium GWF2_37_15]|nr:MAG: hypothetical protein A2Y25_06180 [Candidatus Melainabacteria bacterium GWF2_37_15]
MLSINSLPVTRQTQPSLKFGVVMDGDTFRRDYGLDNIRESQSQPKNVNDAARLISDALDNARSNHHESLNDIKNNLGYELQKYQGADVADVGKRLKAMA